ARRGPGPQEPGQTGALHLDVSDRAARAQLVKGGPPAAGPEAGEREIPGDVCDGRRAERMQRPLQVPAPEFVGRDGVDGCRLRQRPLEQVEALVEMSP